MTPKRPLPNHCLWAVNDSADIIAAEIARLKAEIPHLDTHGQAMTWETISKLTDALRLLERIGAQTRPEVTK